MKATLLVNFLLSATLVSTSLSGCATAIMDQIMETTEKIVNSVDDSHSNESEPNYDVVFPQDSVNRIEITLSSESWTALQTEMEEEFGQTTADGRGKNNQGALPPQGDLQRPDGIQPANPGGDNPGGQFPDNQQFPENGAQRPGGLQPGNQGQGNPGGLNFGDTSYVISTVSFNDETWNSVGFRYSGNSTLQSSWKSGTKKISFRLDFDEYEDEDPSTKNQRFFGFKQLSFKSNAMDSSYLREKVTSDIFLASGVIAPKTAFYEVYVDYGEGLQYFGLYTAVEIVDDTVIQTQFSDDSGNVYKPEGSGAAFVAGTFNEASFEKQTNEEDADWSDIQAVFEALNSDLRTSDPAAWREGLEEVFDVDAFIRWLAVDTIIQNWDTYGAAAHNYYLYTDPEDGLVTWIPWDFNMALTDKAGNGQGGPQGRGVRDLDLASINDQWPLIRCLMDDPIYWDKYTQYLQETIDGIFRPDKLEEMYTNYHDLIAPYVENETSDATQLRPMTSFDQALDELIQHAQERYDEVTAYLQDL